MTKATMCINAKLNVNNNGNIKRRFVVEYFMQIRIKRLLSNIKLKFFMD
jgi:hypothetical protein